MSTSKKVAKAKKPKSTRTVKQELIRMLKANGNWNTLTYDLVDLYAETRDRWLLERNALAEAQSLGVAPDDEAQLRLSEVLCRHSDTMTAILQVLRSTPASDWWDRMERDIRAQLGANGLIDPETGKASEIFEEKISQLHVMLEAFYDAARSLKSRGRTYMTLSSAGKTYEKDNSAAKDIATYPRVIDDLLKSLGCTLDNWANPEDDEL